MTTIVEQVELTTINCGVCGGTYAINERYRRHKYENNGSWTCPYCKTGWGYEGSGMREELAKAKRRAEYAEAEAARQRERVERAERSHAATRGHLTRVKKRVAAGSCPCCKRNFQNLARHMKNQHPEYVEEAG